MHLCRNAYNMVLHKYGERLYSGVQEALRSHLRGVAQNVVHAQGTPFLQELVSRWNEHNKSTQMIRDILMVRSIVQGLGADSSELAAVVQEVIHSCDVTVRSLLC
jgi:hypothetical protein